MKGLLAGVTAVMVATSALAAEEASRELRCERLLEAADEATRESQSSTEIERGLTLYVEAFRACGDPRTLPLKVGVRVVLAQARILHTYENDPARAVEVYEEALRWTAEKGGLNHPSRIGLIEGLAEATHAAAVSRDDPEGLERARRRAVDLYEQALALREAAFGEESLEAAKGLLLLGSARLEAQPVLAEKDAKRALEIARARRGPFSAEEWLALGALKQALRRQGRTEEVAQIEERMSEVAARLEQRGEPLGHDEDSWFVTPPS